MKMNIKYWVLFWSLAPGLCFGVDAPQQEVGTSLEDELQALGTAGNQAPAGVSEKLYAVQTRFSSLRRRHELSLGAGNNLSSDGFLSSNSVDLAYRFHITDRWFAGLSGNFVFNSLTEGGETLVNVNGLVPDVGVTQYRADAMVGYHLFYGKFRLTMDQVFYFDQYVALGPGLVVLDTGNQMAAVADVGIAFWFGRNFSFRVGVKDYFFNEQRRVSSGFVHNFLGYLQAGYVFGG